MAWIAPKDQLNRAKEARFLTDLLTSKFDDGGSGSLVMNINSPWGLGKTYFIDNWAEDLMDLKYPVVKIDAWQSDFSNDPLLVFISEIEQQLSGFLGKNKKLKKVLEKTLDAGKKILAQSPRLLVEVAVRRILRMESSGELKELMGFDSDAENSANEAGKSISGLLTPEASQALGRHQDTKEAIKYFRDSLESLAVAIDEEKDFKLPIFIFVDELDRCRPSYAIETLETIKHLFGVKGVYFAVSTDTAQLSHSVRAIYGSGFESGSYLKRFFDIQYTLPEPNYQDFSRYMIQKYSVKEDVMQRFELPTPELEASKVNGVVITISTVNDFLSLGLRDQIQCFELLLVLIKTHDPSEPIFLLYAYILICLQHRYPEEFEDVIKGHKVGNVLSKSNIKYNDQASFEVTEQNPRNLTLNSRRLSPAAIAEIYQKYLVVRSSSLSDISKLSHPERHILNRLRSTNIYKNSSHEEKIKLPTANYGLQVKHLNTLSFE